MQPTEALDLLPDFRRGVEQEPRVAVGAHGHRLLRSGYGADATASYANAIGATAVPLRKATSRCGAQNTNQHVEPPDRRSRTERQRCNEQRESKTVVFFSLIGTNLCAHVDLFEARRFPVHDRAFQVESQRGSSTLRNSLCEKLGQGVNFSKPLLKAPQL